MEQRAIGIDLGTTNSVVAIGDASGRQPRVLRNALGEDITPSVICFKDGGIVIGAEAKTLQEAGEPDVAAFFKRSMGDTGFAYHANGRDYSAADLSSLLLAQLKGDAEAALGAPIREAVIAVPAFFKNPHREATIAAANMAGLDVLQAINEPTAAAIAYGLSAAPDGRRILVYDLGGGTFDVTILEMRPDGIAILGSVGDHELGGKDWDDWMIRHLAQRFADEYGIDPLDDPGSLADLLVRVEQAKKRLSAATVAKITLGLDGRSDVYEIERTAFEAGTEHLIERTAALCDQALRELALSAETIDGVLLVGGATRMPAVSRLIEQRFGKTALGGVNVDLAVAHGAAIAAAGRAERTRKPRGYGLGAARFTDVTNHSLGMIAIEAKCNAYVNTKILPKGHPIPCTDTRPFTLRTQPDRANKLEIFLTQGESDSPADATYLGLYGADNVAYTPGGETVIDISYSYDLSGTVRIEGVVRATAERLAIERKQLPADAPAQFESPPAAGGAVRHMTIYMAFDLSGSMCGQPISEAKRAALKFLRDIDLTRASVGIIGVADRTETLLPACQDATLIENAIGALDRVEVGYGNAADPFEQIHHLLAGRDGPRFAVILADGIWSNRDAAIRRAQLCHAAGIEIIATGFGAADPAFLAAIASSDESAILTSIEGLTSTFSTIARVLSETGGLTVSGDDRTQLRNRLRRG